VRTNGSQLPLHESDVHRRGAAERYLSGDRRGVPRQSGWRGLPARLSVAMERISSGVGQARRYSIGIRGKRANVWSPHTARSARMGLGRGMPCRDVVASSHGLSCKCGCRDQRGQHEGHFRHLFLHMVAEAKEGLDSLLWRAASRGKYFITRFQRSASFCARCAARANHILTLPHRG
jgi:hypothetical protein